MAICCASWIRASISGSVIASAGWVAAVATVVVVVVAAAAVVDDVVAIAVVDDVVVALLLVVVSTFAVIVTASETVVNDFIQEADEDKVCPNDDDRKALSVDTGARLRTEETNAQLSEGTAAKTIKPAPRSVVERGSPLRRGRRRC